MKKPCLTCGKPSTGSRCPDCGAARARDIEAQRPSREARGYGSEWRRLRLAILDRDGWTCTRCGKQLSGNDATVDHVIPMGRGGAPTPSPDLLASMCRSCNSSKGARTGR